MENIQITSDGIQKNLKRIKPYDAICEYIWNGFDAGAKTININSTTGKLGNIETLTIADDGSGINYEQLNIIFKPFNDSDKYHDKSIADHKSLPHGRHGVGRFTFFKFASDVEWKTVYKDENGRSLSYMISMSNQSLNEYNLNNNQKPQEVEEKSGTIVSFSNVVGIDINELKNEIIREFFWFICIYSNENYSIFVDSEKMNFTSQIRKSVNIQYKSQTQVSFDIKVFLWKTSLGKEYSKFYYINSEGKEVYKENTTLNKKSDHFWHSVYIKSIFFNNCFFDANPDDQIGFSFCRSSEEFKEIMSKIENALICERKEYLKAASDEYISKLIDEDIYPHFEQNSFLDKYRKEQLDAIVESLYEAEPKIFTGLNSSQKKIFIRLLNTIMDSDDKNSLFRIVEEVIDLDDVERADLAMILETTTLSNITATIKLIEDRQRAVQALKQIVFNKEYKSREVEHVQAIVERHFWLFGEQYHLLTSAEPDFNEALRRLIYEQKGKLDKTRISHEDVNKEMDIFMVRQNRSSGYYENVVVELKRPSLLIGETELSQVKKYMRVIISDDRFNSPDSQWKYYLIGNRFNTSGYIEGEIENNKGQGDQGLVYKVKNQRIYVKTWSQIFEDFSVKSDYLLQKLKLSRDCWLKKYVDADEAVKSVVNNSAHLEEYAVPKGI